MFSFKKSIVFLGLVSVLVPLASCANTPFAEQFERSLAADPRLSDNPNPFGQPSPSPVATPTSGESPDDLSEASENTSDAVRPTPNGSNSDNPTGTSSEGAVASDALPQPGDPDFIGPLPLAGATPQATPSANSANSSTGSPNPTAAPQRFSDLDQAPEELRPYIQDLAQLGVLTRNANNQAANQEFQPNAIATRRDYARWLVAANNAIYRDRPAQKIRLGVSSDEPIFRDVPRTDPDFAAIQGLAEAGLIPSSLSGDATLTTFRPDAPLTRENLILWKAPVDVRQTLPNATVQAVQDTWGFQDANRIEPRALRAVLADFQNGDLSNIRRAFGYTTLFQPKKTVTRAEAAAVLWYFGAQGDGLSAKDALTANPN